MSNEAFNKTLKRLAVSCTFLLTASFCPAPIMAVGGALLLDENTIKLLMTAISSVSAGNVASAIDTLFSGSNTHTSLENEDLTRAVGKAIAAVISLEAKKYNKVDTQEKLNKIATYAKDKWVNLWKSFLKDEDNAKRYLKLGEGKLPESLIPTETHITQPTILTVPEWENIFARLNMATSRGGGFLLESKVHKEVAKSLHKTFPKALRETLKEDFARDGKAFAGLTIQLLAGMQAELGKLQKSQQESFNDVLKHFSALESQLKQTEEEQQKVFNEISQNIQSGFEEVCVRLGVTEYRISRMGIKMKMD